MNNPLILTLAIDNASQQYFDELRTAHFPPERNFLKAHLTLFHQLPASESLIVTELQELARQTNPFTINVEGPVSIGNGVAFKLRSEKLSAMHRELQLRWQQWLIPQDAHKLYPHITVQNKVSPDAAKNLLAHLAKDFEPFEITATGLVLWEYLGGPWQFIENFNFADH